ncbi:MAG: exosortase A [Gammaproteobacteria bacterium]|nr:exosortase A [Gammaproteobacteria bacterium]
MDRALAVTGELKSTRWQTAIAANAVTAIALFAVFYSTVASMVHIWYRTGTYAHGFVVLPISIWLIWKKRAHLAAFVPVPNAGFLVPLGLSLVLWGLSRLAGVLVIEQLALVAIVVSSSVTLLGWQIAKFIAFPLLFLFFAVPMGEDLVPSLMEFTASFTVWAVRLSGVPVYRDGLWFSLPTGNWSVVEACSGIRYLIASITLGVMYAYITYHALWKRLLFVLLSVLVPIIANGVRAYMIVMIGHLSEMKYAVGIDHLIYGWIFFGLVMFLLFWIGSFWQEDEEPPRHVIPSRQFGGTAVRRGMWGLSATIICASLLTTSLVGYAASKGQEVVSPIALPDSVGDWTRIDEPTLWQPTHLQTPYVVNERYLSATGNEAQLFLSLYPNQQQGAEAINPENRAIGGKVGRLKMLQSGQAEWGNQMATVRRQELRAGINGSETTHLVWQWYRIAGRNFANRYLGKAWEAIARLYPGRMDGAWIAISTPVIGTEAIADTEKRLADFARAMIPELDRAIDASMGLSD